MSFQDFFPDNVPEQVDDQHAAVSDAYQTYGSHPTRPQPQAAISNVLSVSNTSPYAAPTARTTWTTAHPDLNFFQNNTSQSYYALSTALNSSTHASSPAFPEALHQQQQHPYAPTPKLDTQHSVYQQSAHFTRYQPSSSSSYIQYAPIYLPTVTYDPFRASQQTQELISLEPEKTSQPSVKEEASVPSSPQFIFEFPGGEPEDLDPTPPPLGLAAPEIPFDEPGRAGSPATEEMKSMMSVFRVDPFASYDGGGEGGRKRRKKRASTYAKLADPEGSAKEPPLIFTFQLDVGPGWGLEDAETEDTGRYVDTYDDAEDFGRRGGGGATSDRSYLLSAAFPSAPITDSASTSSLDFSLTYPLSNSRRSSPSPASTSPYSQHVRTKTHVCWICQKEFPRPSGLATHMHTHSGAKPYRCPVPACAKPFAVRSNARRHLRIHSEGELASASLSVNESVQADSGESEDGEECSQSPPPFTLPFVDEARCDSFAYQFSGGSVMHISMGKNPAPLVGVVGAC